MYSAYGSHANYASTGYGVPFMRCVKVLTDAFSDQVHDKVLVDLCDAGPRWDPVQSAYFYHLEPNSFKLTRLYLASDSEKSTNYTSFFYYEGRWGDRQYPDSDPRQETIPYFKLKRFQTGPTGPRAKQLVRKGMFPNHQHVESWTEWGVGVYMFLYPCCLKGWRIYISSIVTLAVLLAFVLGIVFAIQTYWRRRGYRAVDSDIPLGEVTYRGSLESLDSLSRDLLNRQPA